MIITINELAFLELIQKNYFRIIQYLIPQFPV